MTFYFYLCPQGEPEHSGYQHCAIALAEGLRELGTTYSSNVSYWNEGSGDLFKADPRVRPEECDVIVTSADHEALERIPENLFGRGRMTVYIDSSDGWRTRAEDSYYRRFDIVLRTHFNGRYVYPRNVHPWAFGLTSRILAACSQPIPFEERETRVLVNFRVVHPVRRAAAEQVYPAIAERFPVNDTVDEPPEPGPTQDRRYWEATGRRHSPAFFTRLQRTMACAAFGGYFAPGGFKSTESLTERILYGLVGRLGRRTHTVMQYDSWRFWEALAAGCLTLQVDYNRYGCTLPVQPESGTHYVGIDFGDNKSAQFLLDASLPTLASVAEAGRRWAVEYYSPVAAATRLLNLLKAIA